MAASTAKDRKILLESKGIEVIFSQTNLIDEVWTNRPASSATHIFVHESWSGKPLSEKINWIKSYKTKKWRSGLIYRFGGNRMDLKFEISIDTI